MRTTIRVTGLALLACAGWGGTAAAQVYSISDLGTLGSNASYAKGVNVDGVVVGYSPPTTGSAYHAFLFDTQMNDIGVLSGYVYSDAEAVNDLRHCAGTAFDGTKSTRHIFYYDGTNTIDVGAGTGHGINNSDQVVGDSGGRAIRYDAIAATTTTLGNLGTGVGGSALAINDSSTAVGYCYTDATHYHACYWGADGVAVDLGTLGGTSTYDFGSAHAINSLGDIVGQGFNSSGQFHAFFYSNSSGAKTDLGVLGSATSSYAFGVNDAGQVVGYSGNLHAFLWDATNGMQDLSSLVIDGPGWQLLYASGINSIGQIVGAGLINGEYHAFLLTPQ